ncbi:helix-turn-helix transcriptional regulator [Tabrizicola soli]|uniref:Helix-turn-helix transcriptional regulator n=1 Tax=Tabrizicola soli TaxID=2185115 RepID=A0ABV7DT57_9RHOB|nr:helix-turn-helix domain-containing protein [Tabrizicola soli]
MTLTPIQALQPTQSVLMTERDLAARWARSVRTLQRWRKEGYGPAWLQIGGGVLYHFEDVVAFEARMRRVGKAQQ